MYPSLMNCCRPGSADAPPSSASDGAPELAMPGVGWAHATIGRPPAGTLPLVGRYRVPLVTITEPVSHAVDRYRMRNAVAPDGTPLRIGCDRTIVPRFPSGNG